MKRLIVVLCIICLLTNMTAYASETSEIYSAEQKIEKLKKYNIVNCYEDGNFYPIKNITRAEFCKMISVMSGMTADDSGVTDNYNFFSDVPSEHWANQYVMFCYNNGLVNGVSSIDKLYFVDLDKNGNEIGREELFFRKDFNELYGTNATIPQNLFAPDDYITFQDSLKILVCALGYEVMAEARGNYPMGYVKVAKELGIINKEFNNTDYITREDAAEVIYNSLFIPLLIKKSISDENGDRTQFTITDGNNDIPLQTLFKKYFKEYE